MDSMLIWCLLITLGGALVTDISTRKIPNWLVLAGILIGATGSIVHSLSLPGSVIGQLTDGLLKSLFGGLVGLCLTLPLYALRAMGGGDVKLMAAIGTFLGPLQAAGAVLLTFVAGGVLSLAAAILLGVLPRVMANMKLIGFLTFSGPKAWSMMSEIQMNGRLPYAIAIAVGTVSQIWLASRGGWPFA